MEAVSRPTREALSHLLSMDGGERERERHFCCVECSGAGARVSGHNRARVRDSLWRFVLTHPLSCLLSVPSVPRVYQCAPPPSDAYSPPVMHPSSVPATVSSPRPSASRSLLRILI